MCEDGEGSDEGADSGCIDGNFGDFVSGADFSVLGDSGGEECEGWVGVDGWISDSSL